ncbi:MAG: hypothetical protein ACRD1N_03705 [Terriglobia bacterium]
MRRHLIVLLASIAAPLLLWRAVTRAQPAGRTYYVDCSAAEQGNGSRSRPWNTLASANSFHFTPDDQLLLRRGATCKGLLHPLGSGTPGAPIVVSAYGKGRRPIIDGGENLAAVELFDQSGWEIRGLEVMGGDRYGIFIGGKTPHLHLAHIVLANLDVHGAHYTAPRRSDSGEVFLSPRGLGEALDDVLIEHVIAHDTKASEGIIVNAGGAFQGNRQTLGSNIVVENSTVHNVYGDGLLVTEAQHAVIRDNIVYQTGLCRACTGTTPSGLWEWYCHYCIVEGNESYSNHSWNQHDGGDFDIDYYNTHNIVEYNYGHDSDGYCISFFGAGGTADVDNVFRYNICANNGRKASNAGQGDVLVSTWNGGSIDGMEIYNNTFYWNPATNAPAFNLSGAHFSGSLPRFIKNNIVISTSGAFLDATSAVQFNHNLYSTAAHSPAWRYDGENYLSFSAYRAASHQDGQSLLADPRLRDPEYHAAGRPGVAFTLLPGSPALDAGANVCAGVHGCSMGARDFWGHPLSPGAAINIGAGQAP